MNDKYEPLLKFLKSGVDEILYDLVREGVAQIVKLADEKREPVADAARTLHLDRGFTLNWLRARKAKEIIGACVASNRNRDVYVGLIDKGMRCVMASEIFSMWGPAYPDREKTADAAQYLWRNQAWGDWVEFLVEKDSEYILKTAPGRQEVLCAKVADNAWIAFDEGGYRDVLQTLGSERIRDYAEQAKARRSRNESRKMLGVLNIEGYGEHGQRVKVKGLPVYELFNLDPESEIIKVSAKVCGITSVTSASFSSGPEIYQ